MKQRLKLSALRFWRQTARPMLTLVLIVTAFRSAIADWNDVPTGSMKPSIVEGDRVFVNKLAWDLKAPYTTWHLAQWGNPSRGDIAVFYSPADGVRLVKRVIGLPGDRIEMINERLLVNGAPAEYALLPGEVSQALSDGERQASLFATEKIGENPAHPMMVIPTRPALRTFGPLTVPQDSYFMMGDNRDNSHDSRYFGAVPRAQILGKATTVVFSLNHDHYYLPRRNRIFQALP